jgi:NCS1 family nucleobase:cation symporter-1
MVGICIRTCLKAGGVGPLIHQGTQYSTLSPAWAWFYAITSSVGSISSGILNQSDYTRFAVKQGRQVYGTIFGLFFVGTLVPILSILTASASVEIYGAEPYWNPLTLIIQWLLDDYSSANRAAAFFCSLAFVISQLAENILGNGFAAGMDLAGLFPKYINMRRGCLICAILSWVVQPWLFYNTASIFVSVMASFSVFLAPLTGIMLVDYFVIRKQNIELMQLYTGSNEGAYYFTGGVNWRAIFTWVICFTPAMPGMIASLNTNIVLGEGIMNYYRGNYIFGNYPPSSSL